MKLIRLFEEKLLVLFSQGELSGTTHTSIGQEIIAASICEALLINDTIVSNHRCHGHYLAKTGNVYGILAEIMGRKTGLSKGRGGSQHIHDKNFYSNGVQGNLFPVSAGIALSDKRNNGTNVTVIFIGDGTFGEGIIYETLNLIALLKIPILIVVENNRYAQTTPIRDNFAGTFTGRFDAFGINNEEVDASDYEMVISSARDGVNYVRNKRQAFALVYNTYRLAPHSKGDDFREDKEIEEYRRIDPLNQMEVILDSTFVRSNESALHRQLEEAYLRVKEDGFPEELKDLL